MEQTVKATGFSESKIIIPDTDDYSIIADEIVGKELSAFYGVAHKGKIVSASQLANKSCWSQFLTLCKAIDKDTVLLENRNEDVAFIKNLKLDDNKKTVVFIYSYQLGKRGVRRFIKPIMDAIKDDPSFDYIVISIDTPNITK